MIERSIYRTDELVAFRDQTLRFLDEHVKPHGDGWEEDGEVPRSVLRQMGGIGFLGLRYPARYGGVDMGPLASAVFAEALGASTYSGFAATVLVHTDMAGPHLLREGTDAQKERYLYRMVSGELISAIAVTEADAGSDVAGIRTAAKREGDGWLLNGSKMFITNGVYGDLVFVAARTGDEPRGSRGISMFIVERGAEGFSVGQELDKLGWRCSDTAELVFQDCWLSEDALLGDLHRGFYAIMRNFQNERLVLSGLALGEAQTAIDLTLAYTQSRRVSNASLYSKQTIRHRLAMLQARVDAVRQFLYHTAWMMETAKDAVKVVSELKAIAGELVNEVTYTCLQFHGGMGYMRESTIERMYRDARIASIGGGATEVMLEEVAKRSRL